MLLNLPALDWTPPHLETPRLRLRPLRLTDVDDVFAYASNPNLTRYTLWDTHRTREDSFRFVHNYAQSRYEEGHADPLGLILKDGPDAVIGTVGVFWNTRENRALELGYALAEPYWGRGLIAEAGRAVIDYAFASTDALRVQAHHMAENVASGRVLEKLGLTREGTLRQALWHRGRAWDIVVYSLLRAEWRGPTG